jgi:hypothetical protein
MIVIYYALTFTSINSTNSLDPSSIAPQIEKTLVGLDHRGVGQADFPSRTPPRGCSLRVPMRGCLQRELQEGPQGGEGGVAARSLVHVVHVYKNCSVNVRPYNYTHT